jgi:hypothetical protein
VGNMPMSFQEYLKYAASTSDDMPLYLFDKDFLATAPHLAHDFSVPAVFTEDLFSVLGPKRPDYRSDLPGSITRLQHAGLPCVAYTGLPHSGYYLN